MQDNNDKTETNDKTPSSLKDRRLKSIANGDLDWMGKGFLAVIKKDCGASNIPKTRKNDSSN